MKTLLTTTAALTLIGALATDPAEADAAEVVISAGVPTINVWMPGHFEVRMGHNVWVEGGWNVRRPPPQAWVPGHWERRGRGQVWVPGHYR